MLTSIANIIIASFQSLERNTNINSLSDCVSVYANLFWGVWVNIGIQNDFDGCLVSQLPCTTLQGNQKK